MNIVSQIMFNCPNSNPNLPALTLTPSNLIFYIVKSFTIHEEHSGNFLKVSLNQFQKLTSNSFLSNTFNSSKRSIF